MKTFFKSSFGELTKFVGNCVPKLSSKTGKRTLILIRSGSFDIIIPDEENLVSCLCFEIALVNRSQIVLDRAFKQEKSNIIENTFSACNICKGRLFWK